MASTTDSITIPSVTATYAGPSTSAPFTVSESVSARPSSSTVERTTYLASLRAATETAQARINQELTRRMDEDKAREAATTGRAPLSAEDEAKEEQNYGEEVAGDDD
jgi:hypothetical protein